MVEGNKKPNIVYVFADQFRRQALGFWSKDKYKNSIMGLGDPVYTPNLDSFAEESIVCTNVVSNCPVCSPHRGMLFSGMFPNQNGVKFNCNSQTNSSLRKDIKCLTDIYKENGYSIGYLGKWHLDKPLKHFDREGNYVGEGGKYYSNGCSDSCWDMYTPPGAKRHSIDYWYSYGTFDVHRNPHYWDNNGVKHEPKKWSAEHEADIAIDYIKNTSKQRNNKEPFCLFVSMNPPHTPYHDLQDTDAEAFEAYYSQNKADDISSLLVRENVDLKTAQHYCRYYFSHITGVDKQFGRILKALEQEGLKENTIVIFSSDHGEMMGSHGLMYKNMPYEESIGIPFIIRYPAKLKHDIEDIIMSSTDIMPTLLGLSGLEHKIPMQVEGTDYSSIFINRNEKEVNRPKSALYIFEDREGKQIRGVRTEKYTFCIEKDTNKKFKNLMLFNNVDDPYQINNICLEDLSIDEQNFLKSELGYWLKKSNDEWYKLKLYEDFICYPE